MRIWWWWKMDDSYGLKERLWVILSLLVKSPELRFFSIQNYGLKFCRDQRTADLVVIFKGGWRDLRTADLVIIFRGGWSDPRTADLFEIFKRGWRDLRTADLVIIFRGGWRDLRTADFVAIFLRGWSDLLTADTRTHGRPNRSKFLEGMQGFTDCRFGPKFKQGMKGPTDYRIDPIPYRNSDRIRTGRGSLVPLQKMKPLWGWFGRPLVHVSALKNVDWFGGPWIPAFPFKNSCQIGRPLIHAMVKPTGQLNFLVFSPDLYNH